MLIGLNIGTRQRQALPLASKISGLFASGSQGVWYDPSDFSTLFQDDAGATPVTAVGQSVGRMLDKSGRGNHLTQATAGFKPVVQVDGSGKFYLSFDGVDDRMVTAAAQFRNSASKTVAYGVNPTVALTGSTSALISTAAADWYVGAFTSSVRSSHNNSSSAQKVTDFPSAYIQNTKKVHIHKWSFSNPNVTVSHEANGTILTASPAQPYTDGYVTTTATSSLILGAFDSAGAAAFPANNFYGSIVVCRNTSQVEDTAIREWLKIKVGATF